MIHRAVSPFAAETLAALDGLASLLIPCRPLMGSPRAVRLAWTFLLAALAGVAAAQPFRESDVFWHLSLGRAVLRHGARVVPEPHAFLAFGRPCTAQEWLWDVATFALHRAFGWTALAWLVIVLASASAWCVVRLLVSGRVEPHPGALALVSALVMAGAHQALDERPESATVVLLPTFMLAGRWCVEAPTRRARLSRGAVVVALELLWAQVHPTFILAPAVFVLTALAGAGRTRDHAPTAAALALGLGSSAFGAKVFHNVLSHAHGDAVRHISDMVAPTWGFFHPLRLESGFLFVSLLALGAAGVAVTRKVPWGELGLAALGAALVATAVRGVAQGSILAGPFALEGALALVALAPLRARSVLALAAFIPAGLLTYQGAMPGATWFPPSASTVLAPGWYPRAAAAWLRRAPPGTPVLTTFASGAPLGFWLDGRVRTFVDSRTPLYFDDAEYGLARAAWFQAGALERTAERFGTAAAVVERDVATCDLLRADPRWYPVVVDAHTTTFVRRGAGLDGAAVTRLAPCGLDYLTPDACADGGVALGGEIAALTGVADAPFVRYLQAERLARCRVPGVSPASLLALLPSSEDAAVFGVQRDTLAARLLVADGRLAEAYELVTGMMLRGDPLAYHVVLAPLIARRDQARLRALLEGVVRALGDDAPGDVRAMLAQQCAARGDFEGARFHGLRAAVMGSPSAAPALCWLRNHHPDRAVRADAEAWVATLQREHPGLECRRRSEGAGAAQR